MHRTLVWTGKGGTGKTTTCANLGPALAAIGYRVLLVGFDPQDNLEQTYGIDRDDRSLPRVEQLLAGGIDPRSAIVPIEIPKSKGGGSLSLLPASRELNAQLTAVARRDYDDLDLLLSHVDDDYDIAIIDTQGALTPLSRTALRAADSVLFSCEPGFYEAESIVERLDELEALAEEDERWLAEPLGIVLVRTAAKSRHMREYRAHFSSDAFDALPVFDAYVRQQSSVRDHPALGQPTILAEPKSKVAQDYAAVAEELVKRLSSKEATA